MAADDDNSTGTREPRHRLRQRFEVIRKLGHGTYGKVQLAINKETGQEVAIKTIKKAKIENGQDLIRIRREIQIMSYIQHPHIIHIHEVFENKEKIVLVMQYASGGELYDYLKTRRGASEADSRRIFRQIVSAVYYCHKNKICHRDLKLENILLDEKGNAKIADFGLSNVFSDDKFLHTFCGSPLYASPEIVKGKPYYGPEVDCWSLGVLLYTLIYGAMPFDGSNFRSLVRQISEGDYYEPKRKSDASGLIQHLLTVKPSKRATVADICDHWWVNLGFEHPLTQVAEDMANFSPINVDAFLNLPQTSRNEQVKSPRKRDCSRSRNSPIVEQSGFCQEGNECKAAKLVTECCLSDRNYDVVNSDSISCSDDSLIVNNIGPSKETGIENSIFPSDCFRSVPDKNAVPKCDAKLPSKERATNYQDKKRYISQPEFGITGNKLSATEKVSNLKTSTTGYENSCNVEMLNKSSMHQNEVTRQIQTNTGVTTVQESFRNKQSNGKNEMENTTNEKSELSAQSATAEKSMLKEGIKNKACEKKSMITSSETQRMIQAVLSKDSLSSQSRKNGKTCGPSESNETHKKFQNDEDSSSHHTSKNNQCNLKACNISIRTEVDKSQECKERRDHPQINCETKAENGSAMTIDKCIDEINTQNLENTLFSKDNGSQPSKNEVAEISQNCANTAKDSDSCICIDINKSVSDEEKLVNQEAINTEMKSENKSMEKMKDPPQDGKKLQSKKGPGKLVIPKFFEATQTTERPADNKKIAKPLWCISDAKKAFENKPQEKKPIYIPTRRVSDARSKFEQKIESNQFSTLPRRASKHNNALKQDFSTCSLSSVKSDQGQGSELDKSSLRNSSESDVQKPSCTQNICKEPNAVQTSQTSENEPRIEKENSDHDQAKKTSFKAVINEINSLEENQVLTDNFVKSSLLCEDKRSGNQNKTDNSDKEALETIAEVSSSSIDLENTSITQNHNCSIIPNETNSSVEETKHAACQSQNVIEAVEEQQHKCNFHEGTTLDTETMPCFNTETDIENKNIKKCLSGCDQEVKIKGSITDKQDPNALEEKIVLKNCHKRGTEENLNVIPANNDSGNCSDNEIGSSSKAQSTHDHSSGYISESQSLFGGEEQDINEDTKLDLLKRFMEKECSPLNALLQNSNDQSQDFQCHELQKPSSVTTSEKSNTEIGINSLPLHVKKSHQSRRRHSDAQSLLQSHNNQTSFGLRDISDLPESCYNDMLRLLNSRDAIRTKFSTPSVLSKDRHTRHTANKDHQARIQQWIKSEQRNGHSTDKDSSDNDDDFDIHLDYNYPATNTSSSYQNLNSIEDTLAPVQHSSQFPTTPRPVCHTGYKLTDEFSTSGSYKTSSLFSEEIDNLIGIPNRNLNYARRHSHAMRYKDPFEAHIITPRYMQNPMFQSLFPGYYHSNHFLHDQLKVRPNVAELYGTLRGRPSCKPDILELSQHRDDFHSTSSITMALHKKQNTIFGRDASNVERIRRNYTRSLSLDIPDTPHLARTNCEINSQTHIPWDYTTVPIQRHKPDSLHSEEECHYVNNVTNNYPSYSQNSHNTTQRASGEMKISEDLVQCEMNKFEPDTKENTDSKKLSEYVEVVDKPENSLLQQNTMMKQIRHAEETSHQNLSVSDGKDEKIEPPSKQIGHKTSLSLLDALKMQGYKTVIAQSMNLDSNISDSINFDRSRPTDEQECLRNLQNPAEQGSFKEQKIANGNVSLSSDHPNLVLPMNYEFPQYENPTFPQSSSKQLATVQESNESLSCKLDSDQEESVSERIWRKSFYSRFNDSLSKRRKSSREGDIKAQSISGSSWDILLEDNFKEDILSRRRSSLTLGNSYISTLPRSGIKPLTKPRSCGSEVSDPLLQINDSSMIHKSSYRQKCSKNNKSSSLEAVENISEDSSFPVQRPAHNITADRDLLYTTSATENPYNRLYGTLSSAYCSNNRQSFSQVRDGEDCRSVKSKGGILPRRRYSTFDSYLYLQKTPIITEPTTSVSDSKNAENDEFS